MEQGGVSFSSGWLGIHYVSESSLEFMIFLFKPPKSWDYRHGNSVMSLEVDAAVVVIIIIVLSLVLIRTL